MMTYLRIAFLLIFIPFCAFAETRLIISEGSYNMGDGETPTVAESRALLNAKRTALEQAGTYVESYSRTKNYQLTADEVKVIASGLMQVTILEKKRTIVGDGLSFWVKIEARVNSEKMEDMAARVKEKSMVEDYKKVQEEYEKSRKEISDLKKQLLAAQQDTEKKKIATLIANDEKSFQANEWFEKGSIFNLNFEHEKAIEAYTNAIALNPNYAEAYERRGIAYYNKGLYRSDKDLLDRGIEDFKKVTLLKPKTLAGAWAQGIIDISQNKYAKALASFSQAVAYDPESELGYLGRGITYAAMNQPERALEEYTRAIKAKGFWQAIVYRNRAVIYAQKKEYSKAVRDLDQAITLAPSNAHFYYLRGVALAMLGNMEKANTDYDKACKMGDVNGCSQMKSLLTAERVLGSYYMTGRDGMINENSPRITFELKDGKLIASSPPASSASYGTTYKTISDVAIRNNALTFTLRAQNNQYWNVAYIVADFSGDAKVIPINLKQISGNFGSIGSVYPGFLIRDEKK
jgi:tetratricopeptide (TPR) repeat protein